MYVPEHHAIDDKSAATVSKRDRLLALVDKDWGKVWKRGERELSLTCVERAFDEIQKSKRCGLTGRRISREGSQAYAALQPEA